MKHSAATCDPTLRPRIVQLAPADVDEIVELERRCFIPPLQADRQTLLDRFAVGHQMVGIKSSQLQALIGYYFTELDPDQLESLPANEKEFCLLPSRPGASAVVVYNLEVDPSQRGLEYARRLLDHALRHAKQLAARHSFGNARLPSYAGSDPQFAQEFVAPSASLRAAIDAHLCGGKFPAEELLMQDPRLGLYRALTQCRFLKLLPGFAPTDTASGGMRLLVYRDLTTWMGEAQ